MSRSNIEEALGVGWLIVALLAEDKHPNFAMLAAGLAILSLIGAIVFTWSDRSEPIE